MTCISFSALSVQSSGGDSWTKQVSYTGSEPNSEVVVEASETLFEIPYINIICIVCLQFKNVFLH